MENVAVEICLNFKIEISSATEMSDKYMARIALDDLSERLNTFLNYFLFERRGTQHFHIIIL